RGAHRVEHLPRPVAAAAAAAAAATTAVTASTAARPIPVRLHHAARCDAPVTPALACLTARLAPLRHLAEALPLVELLLAGGENEVLVAIDAIDGTVLEFHGSPRSTLAVGAVPR